VENIGGEFGKFAKVLLAKDFIAWPTSSDY